MDSADVSIDNQFLSVPELRPARPMPAIRQDYRELLENLRLPSLPVKADYRNLDGVIPTQPSQVISQEEAPQEHAIEVTEHSSHQPLISRNLFQSVLESSAASDQPTPIIKQRQPRFRLPKLNVLQVTMVSLAAVILSGGIYLTVVGWQSTNLARKQAFSLTKIANQVDKSTAATATTKNPALSTTPISASTLANYNVAPNLPRYLIIPSLKVDARVLAVGVTSTGALATPSNIYDTAWYNESSLPGQPGAMLIDGHVSSWSADGAFYGLKKLVAGNSIQVERGDGTMFTYKVVSSQVYPSGKVNMQAAVTPVVAGQPGLNLITCTGDVIPGTSTFSERIIVFATQISS